MDNWGQCATDTRKRQAKLPERDEKRKRSCCSEDLPPTPPPAAAAPSAVSPNATAASPVGVSSAVAVDLHQPCTPTSPKFGSLSEDLRFHILSFLCAEDLHASLPLVSKKCRLDCQDERLPQQKGRTGVLTINKTIPGMSGLFASLCLHGFLKESALRLELLSEQLKPEEWMKKHTSKIVLKDHHLIKAPMKGTFSKLKKNFISDNLIKKWNKVRSLDMSFSPSELPSKTDRQIPLCLPKALSLTFTGIRHLNMDHVIVRRSALTEFAKNCKHLEVLHWNGASGENLSWTGHDLKECKNLKELYLDDSILRVAFYNDLFREEGPRYPLMECNGKLERVSLKNAKYKYYNDNDSARTKARSLPPWGLLKLVRHTPSLRWFRSNLSQMGVTLLRDEFREEGRDIFFPM